jgi:hypothetical protein
MEDNDEPTCGKGIAANAVLPAKLAELMNARAEVLDQHTRALDLTDTNARIENDAYAQIVRAHREIGVALDNLARQMAGCRDLPMGRHDMNVMADPKGQMEAFRQFVHTERELSEFLRAKVEEDEKYLS